MDPLTIQSTLRGISGSGQLGSPELRPALPTQAPGAGDANSDFPGIGSASGPSFGDTLAQYLGEVNSQALSADKGMEDLAAGRSQNIHNTLIAMQKADVQLKLLVETRNKVISAYQEIMRMQA